MRERTAVRSLEVSRFVLCVLKVCQSELHMEEDKTQRAEEKSKQAEILLIMGRHKNGNTGSKKQTDQLIIWVQHACRMTGHQLMMNIVFPCQSTLCHRESSDTQISRIAIAFLKSYT